MDQALFNLKFTSKQLVRQANKSEKSIRTEKLKLKKAIEKGNMEGAKIYAENAIRKKNEALNYLRLASRVDAVAARVETAVRMKQVTRSMAGIVKGMDKAMNQMDMRKVTEVMDKFESQFEDLDVKSQYVQDAVDQSTTLSVPQEDVQSLIQQVADEHGLEIAGQLDTVAVPVSPTKAAADEQDELTARLNKLRG